jgi:hypothetical protein
VEFSAVDSPEEVSSSSSGASATLPAIPENPYHVLEDGLERRGRRDRAVQNGVGHGRGGVEPGPPQILRSLSLSEDEDYDRLVGPPHIYQILQKSLSLVRPHVVRECSPVSGYHHLDRSDPAQHTLQHCVVHLVPDGAVPSEESSTVSGSELFDDPQYNTSPKRAANGTSSSSSTGSGQPTTTTTPGKPQQRNGHAEQVTTPEREKVVDLSKYRGDYERDPTYMKLVQKLMEPSSSEDSDHTDVRPLMRVGSNKSASLPDINNHTYQSLQALTRDPLRNYEMLHKRQMNIDFSNV